MPATPTPKAKALRKPGANRNDKARKSPPRDANFKQSRDVREDRGARQMKTTVRPAAGRK